MWNDNVNADYYDYFLSQFAVHFRIAHVAIRHRGIGQPHFNFFASLSLSPLSLSLLS